MTIRTPGAASLLREFELLSSVSSLEEITAGLDPAEAERANRDWLIWGRDNQLPPADGETSWRTWLMLGGRGAGKTRAGAEWIKAQALGLSPFAHEPARRIALVGETIAAVRSVMVEGVSGLLAVHKDADRPLYEPSKRQLVWRTGAIAQIFSAEEPDALRGPQFSVAWLDEICKWHHADATFDMLQFALRLGRQPRQVVTTTPRPMALLKRILGDAGTVTTRMTTRENAKYLAPDFIRQLETRYGGTPLLRQEIDGELIEDRPDALWKRDLIEAHRLAAAPELSRIVVAVDPPVTSGAKADACGIVVAGIGEDGRGYVIDDRTVRGREPLAWAEVAVRAYHAHEADAIVAEVNQGGELVPTLIRQVDADIPIELVRATRGKWIRAEPVAALYQRGLVSHAGSFPDLEDQMCDFGPDGLSGGRSPDRMDALVWALTALMLGGGQPRVREM